MSAGGQCGGELLVRDRVVNGDFCWLFAHQNGNGVAQLVEWHRVMRTSGAACDFEFWKDLSRCRCQGETLSMG